MHLSYLALAISLPYAMLLADQIPLRTDSLGIWDDLSASPDANETSRLIFDTVNSLLQHWPNTRYRNGHTIVPGTVPVGTLLYHGRADSSLPAVPEWTAIDPEHAFPFCSAPPRNASAGTHFGTGSITGDAGCWQLTLVATRALHVLYFDGSSGAKIKDGALDAQDLLVWGVSDPERVSDDRARIEDLYAWGKEFGVDGYVRMEMDFEIALCDFTAGVKLVSAEFLAAWWSTTPTWHTPPWQTSATTPDLDPTRQLQIFETLRAGAWHNRYPGETRIILDMTRLVSFYDNALAPSLVAARVGQERWDHRLQDISHTDLAAVRTRLKAVLKSMNKSDVANGVDWRTLLRVPVDHYADRLEMLEYLLNTTTLENIGTRATTIQTRLRVMLTPYTLYDVRPAWGEDTEDAWAGPVWRSCATRHTAHIHMHASTTLTMSERLLLGAFDQTTREICRVIVRMWAAGVRAGLDGLIPVPAAHLAGALPVDPMRVVQGWREETNALIAWLDWSVWVKCRPACGFEETCYLPTCPYFWIGMVQPSEEDDNNNNLWKRPQPRCIRQFEPYSVF
ncbi:hypothetical protein B0H17DRAFT_1022445 [Mycena rosella]|uniref:Uncharacterized protein n=1 Tax=Mycena rosella TaxID=1033263 RepID=A0AAD7G1P6_MYCRO|nr:hypothetical protein B0H17DRAFT_1022445 [Mycena rosella]